MNTTQTQLQASACLSCGSENVVKRGLCYSCYEKYRRERDKLPAKQRSHFDEELIAANLLATDARKATNVFVKIRERVAREFSGEENPDEEPALIQPVGKPKKRAVKKPAVESSVKRKKA